MKLSFLIPILLILSLPVAHSQSYRLNDTLYLWEMHGANMVSHPDQPTQKVEKFYYGSSARVVDTKIGKYPARMEVNPGFELQGYWVRVIMDRDTGYIFDGFLSHLRPFDLRTNERGIALAQKNFSTDEAVSKDLRMFREKGPEEGQQINLTFKNGLHWNIKNVKSCFVETYSYPNNRLAEAYQFMMAVYSNYFDHNATFMSEPEFLRTTGNKYEFLLKEKDVNRRITLFRKGSGFIIGSHHCKEGIR